MPWGGVDADTESVVGNQQRYVGYGAVVVGNQLLVYGAVLVVAARVNRVPVDFESHAVDAGSEVGGYGERGRIHAYVAVGGGTSLAVFAVVVRERHGVVVAGEFFVGIQRPVEATVTAFVEIHVSVHPVAFPVESGRYLFAGPGHKADCGFVVVKQLVGSLTHLESLLPESGRCEVDGVEAAAVGADGR